VKSIVNRLRMEMAQFDHVRVMEMR
jgi:hypothetical protein